jgi:pantetheine-phosphate adenylyltransferase
VNRRGLYAGSFDPITNGHIDIMERAAKLVDYLYVVIGVNAKKKVTGLFDVVERKKLIFDATNYIHNMDVCFHTGLMVEFAKQNNIDVMFRGMRPVGDFEGEYQLQQLNQMLSPKVETVFLMCKPEFQVVSSGGVREIASLGGDISRMVPEGVRLAIEAKLENQ